jgi:hypothetical protein
VPATHTEPDAQAFPQEPQFVALLAVTTQTPPQAVWPDGHAQLPDRQTIPPAHALPHAPQWALLLVVLTSQPLPALPSQLAKPVLQVSPQVPAPQLGAELAAAPQANPHAPQLVVVAMFVSHPLSGLPSQSL